MVGQKEEWGRRITHMWQGDTALEDERERKSQNIGTKWRGTQTCSTVWHLMLVVCFFKGFSVSSTMNKYAGIHKVIRNPVGTGLGLIQECENTEFWLPGTERTEFSNPYRKPDRLLTGKKEDEKQEEIKPISTKHLSLRGLETIADVKNGCGYLFMSSCHDNQHSSYLSALQAN